MLDVRVGRWLSLDKMKNDYPAHSPYNSSLNIPIYFIDPDGNVIIDANGNIVTINKDDQGKITGFNPDIDHVTKEFLVLYLDSEEGTAALEKMVSTVTEINIKISEDAALNYDATNEKFSPIAAESTQKGEVSRDLLISRLCNY